jgi:hypothetical protein
MLVIIHIAIAMITSNLLYAGQFTGHGTDKQLERNLIAAKEKALGGVRK